MGRPREMQKIGDGLWVDFDGEELRLARKSLDGFSLLRKDVISLNVAEFTALLNYVENLNAQEVVEQMKAKRAKLRLAELGEA